MKGHEPFPPRTPRLVEREASPRNCSTNVINVIFYQSVCYMYGSVENSGDTEIGGIISTLQKLIV